MQPMSGVGDGLHQTGSRASNTSEITSFFGLDHTNRTVLARDLAAVPAPANDFEQRAT